MSHSLLTEELKSFLTPSLCAREDMHPRILQRIEEGNLTREENPISHFNVQFIPYNPATREVFMVHHKKSGLWIAAGGHIEKGETLLDVLNKIGRAHV